MTRRSERSPLRAWSDSMPAELSPPPETNAPGRILRASREVFARGGFEATTTRAIARTAGVNLATIHYHFGSKERLYRRVLSLEMADVFAAMARQLAETPLGPRETLLELPQRIIRTLGADSVRLALLRREFGNGARHLQQVVEELGPRGPKGFRKLAVALIASAQERGEMRREDPETIFVFLLTQAYGLLFMGPVVQRVFGRKTTPKRFLQRTLREEKKLLERALSRSDEEVERT